MHAARINFLRPPGYAQVLLIAVVSTALVLATNAFAFRSQVNILWMIGLPVLLGLALNSGSRRRAIMTAVLVTVSLVTTMIVGVNLTSYS